MKHRDHFAMSPLQCRVLSVLAAHGGTDGISCTRLAQMAGISRPVLYVLVRRLAARRWAKRSTITLRGPGRRDTPETHVLYAITAAGLKARERYAAELHLNPY